jgi:DNA-binding transcriptional MerR regulator
MAVTISKLADQIGVSTDTLRYYERRGLLPEPPRSQSGYRLYDEKLIERLAFIKSAQRIGLRLDDIKELLEVMDKGSCPCGHTAGMVERRVAEIDAELRRLRAMRKQLVALGEWNKACIDIDAPGWWCATDPVWKGGEST